MKSFLQHMSNELLFIALFAAVFWGLVLIAIAATYIIRSLT